MKNALSLKHINKLAIPALISGVAEPILSITDTAIIGNVSVNATESLAAVGIVGTFMSMLIWVFGQTRSAISSIISQYVGANNLNAVKNLPAQAIFIVLCLSVLIIVITYPLASYIFKLYNASNVILNYSVAYYKIRVFGFPFTLFTIAIFGTFRGLQNTFQPMVIAIIGAFLNIILDFVLVYGINGFIAPIHIEGAAYASVIAQIIMAMLSAYYLLKKTSIPLLVSFPFNKEIRKFIGMVANLFVRTLALNVTLYFATRLATGYGKNYIAAYTIAINLWFLGAFIIDGYSSAGNILSGKFFGGKNYKSLVYLNKKLIKIGLVVGITISVIGAIIYKPIGLLFTKETEVLNTFYNVFWIVLLMQPICSIAFIFDGVFKGLGKMKLLRNVLLLSTFVVFIPIVYTLDFFNFKLNGIFIALTFWMVARSLPLLIYFKKQFIPLAKNS
ncbi:MATE family efflux transporter [Seonamhaeicola algicola]|uniref:Multidrug-efflux transporter n=1 Tax=Seonamhaeicola algicola TaxID=1719036 RepID=A0A5C7AYY5_9FLAO|nr:MATE family efflux transporter [Seonamhaeicola algicola]TXE12893.1 MATE family efflux transporter [Seonamhaeicola algicola]